MRPLTSRRPQRATIILLAIALTLAAALAVVSHVKARNDAGALFLDWNGVRAAM
ncbi:hypothetical protein [Methylobacterium durans]|uniref:hypothetical protein n=1 Tax=Methylobacterium durans TaxID=2202825 RepID=UPI0013A557D4|nr:hypothetical protein [Methylobacterium durans]